MSDEHTRAAAPSGPTSHSSGPYSEHYQTYLALGWRGVFPLPLGRKHPPPKGCTGRSATDPAPARCRAWAEEGQRNIGIRLPDTVIGLDVDHYGNKTGGDTLKELESDLGPLPPTWRCSSREDGVSGIRLYRVPDGTKLRDGLPGIDIIQSHHRYIVAPPSIHPEGGTYRWLHEATGDNCGPPRTDELPELPSSFREKLAAATPPTKAPATNPPLAPAVDVNEVLAAMPTGRSCQHIRQSAAKVLGAGARHDDYRDAVMAIVRYGRRGCPGAVATLEKLEGGFIHEVTQDGTRRRPEAESEWRRLVDGACVLVADEPQRYGCDVGAMAERTGPRGLLLTRASDLKVLPVRWLWEQRIPSGSLALLAGPEGLGKSTVAYWIAARLTRGELPGKHAGAPRAVLIAATEDSWEHTIVPRLLAAGADLDLVYRIEVDAGSGIRSELVLPQDNEALEHVAAQTSAALLLLDPLISRVSSRVDTHKDADVRQALEPIVAIAGSTGMAVLGIMHFNKGGGSSLDSIMASKAFTAVARSVHTVIPDPDDVSGEARLFGTAKSNLSTTQQPLLRFRIVGHDVPTDEGSATSTGKLEWLGEADESVDSALSRVRGNQDRGMTVSPADWLADYVAENGGVAGRADVIGAAAGAGFSEDQMKRAFNRLGLSSERRGYPSRSRWMTRQYVAENNADQSVGAPRPTSP